MTTTKKNQPKKIFCAGTTKEGKPCKRRVKNESDYCSVHEPKVAKSDDE